MKGVRGWVSSQEICENYMVVFGTHKTVGGRITKLGILGDLLMVRTRVNTRKPLVKSGALAYVST